MGLTGKTTTEYQPLLPDSQNSSRSSHGAEFLPTSTRENLGKLPPNNDKPVGLSSFFGVFVPCVLSIFSVVLFLRLGYVLGQAGLYLSLGSLFVGYAIVTITTLSISAISTNGVVKGGGAYYMISRSLGPEFGGAIGIIFFFANIFASGLYVAGFVETLIEALPFGDDDFIDDTFTYWVKVGFGAAVLILVVAVCLVGAGAFAKASFAIFLLVMTSVIHIIANFFWNQKYTDVATAGTFQPGNFSEYTTAYTGLNMTTLEGNLYPLIFYDKKNPNGVEDYTTGSVPDFRGVFGVLFNGCTGIMAGANMSGDLADASKSIPRGTFQATAFTFVIYVIIFVLSSATCTRDLLLYNFGYMQAVSAVPQLVLMGIFAATLSAALSTLIGASRILQALSRDNILGEWFKVFSKEKKEPIRAVLLCWLLVQLVLLIGEVNIIAPIVSMLFLLSYAFTNIACFVLKITGTPNFRPSFKYFSWHTALSGALSCILVMFMIDPGYAGVSLLLFLALFLMIQYRQVAVPWGDVTQALIYHQVRKYLLRLNEQNLKCWRPQILNLVENPRECFNQVLFVNEIKKGGLYILGNVVVDEMNKSSRQRLKTSQKAWESLDKAAKVKAFVDCVIAPSFRIGAQSLMQASGLGGMRPNIIIMGFYNEGPDGDQLVEWRNALAAKNKRRVLAKLSTHKDDEINKVLSYFPVNGEASLANNMTLFKRDGNATESNTDEGGLEENTQDDDDKLINPNDFNDCEIPKERTGLNPKVSEAEYVGVIDDILGLEKSVGICRNFAKLQARMECAKDSCATTGEKWNIDIWPLVENSESEFQNSYEMLLQLSNIVHLLPRWHKNTKIRVVHFVQTTEEVATERLRMEHLLHDVRIVAEVKVLVLELQHSPALANLFRTETGAQCLNALTKEQAFQLNGIIKKYSSETCVVFTILPSPSTAESATAYLDNIRTLTDNLPPTMMMQCHEVVSTRRQDAV
eukprot:m.9902 g.9902  ORF g.9902 m.9902 type:complete len:973 (+) comp8006_c0_seq1:86-3004(+)